jgi:hypothetical protein
LSDAILWGSINIPADAILWGSGTVCGSGTNTIDAILWGSGPNLNR